ncbi:MAG: hypothetical protein HQK75_16560, partial [Candidatus Magnetomorum sp.]|nr:hypothetical protein [Candidatus Magnetomorum sp.]
PLPDGTTTDIIINLDASLSDPVLVGALNMNVADAVTLSGTFVVTSKDEGAKIIIGAQNVESFMGANAGEEDAIGVKTTVDNLGLILVDTSKGMKYALSGSGGVELVGLDGLDVQGDVGININTTGMVIDESIDIANPLYDSSMPETGINSKRIQASVTYTDAANKIQLSGDIVLSVADIFEMSGTVEFEKLSTGIMTVIIPQAAMAIVKDDEDLASVSGRAAFTIAPKEGFQLDSWAITGFSLFGVDASFDNLRRNTKADTETDGITATNTFEIGPLAVNAPTVNLADFNFKDSKLMVTLGMGVESASLNFDAAIFSSEVTGLSGTFDVLIDVLGYIEGDGSVDFTGKWNVDIDSFDLTIKNLFVAAAEGVHFGYDPDYKLEDDPNPDAKRTGQTLLTIDSATIAFPRFGISGQIQTYNEIPGLTVWEKGFRLGTGMIAYGVDLSTYTDMPVSTGESDGKSLKIGNILELDDIRFGVSNFGIIFGESLDFDGEIFIASGGAKFFPDFSINATITDSLSGYTSDGTPESEDDVAIYASVTFTDGEVDGLKFEADTFDINLGKFLSLYAEDVMIDTSAGQDDEVVSFSSIGATLAAGPLNIGGEARNFAFTGSGQFITHEGFGVFFAVDNLSGSSVSWPDWLPVVISEIGIEWPDIDDDPTNFILTMSAAVTSIPGIKVAKFTGAIEGIKIDVQKLVNFEFPIIDIEAISVGVTANAFGGEISGAFLGGILKIDENNQIISATAPSDTTVAERILYMGIHGGLEMPGLGGLGIRFALSELGPLAVLVNADIPLTIEPSTGLTLTDFTAGVEFFTTLPDYEDPLEMRGNEMSFGTDIDAATWLDTVKQQVLEQHITMKDSPGLGFMAAFSSPMTITGSAKLYSRYLSQKTFNGVVGVKFSTDGKFYCEGALNFAADMINVKSKLYANLSKIQEGSAAVLLLAEVPSNVQILTIYGGFTMGFVNSDGKEVTFTNDNTLDFPEAVVKLNQDISKNVINENQYIDIVYKPSTSAALDIDSILDETPEFTLEGEGALNVSIDNSKVEQIDNETFRYLLTDDSYFDSGNIRINFLAETFQDASNNQNQAQEYKFNVQTASIELVSPLMGSVYDIHDLKKSNYIAVYYMAAPGSKLNEDAINDEDHVMTITLPDGKKYEISGPPEKTDNAWKYMLPEDFEYQVGEISIEFQAGTFTDLDGNTNEKQVQTFTVQGPKATLIDPYADTAIDVMMLNNRGTIDVRFEPTSQGTIDTDSILDEASEFTLTDQYGTVYDITGVPDEMGNNIYRYTLPDNLTFTPGEMTINFKAESFSETSGLTNLAQTQMFIANGATASLTGVDNKGYINKARLNSQGYIDVEFQPTDGNTTNADSILDTDAEFNFSGEAAESVTIQNDSVEQIDDTTFRYYFDGAFTTGDLIFELIEGSFSDSGEFTNLAETKDIHAQVSQGTLVEPQPLSSQEKAEMNSKGYFLVDYTDPFGFGLDEASITDTDLEFRLDGAGADSVILSGDAEKVVLDEKTYWKYAFDGNFDDGLVTINFIKDSWADSKGYYGEAETQEFTVFSLSESFEFRIFGGVTVEGMKLDGSPLDDIDNDGDPDKLISLTGDVTLTLENERDNEGDSVAASLALDISATLKVYYLGNIGSAAGRFILAAGDTDGANNSLFGPISMWGVLKAETNLDFLKNYTIEAELEGYFKLNSTGDEKLEKIRLEGIKGNNLFTTGNNGISNELPALMETSKEIPDALRQAFVDNGIVLSDDLNVLCVVDGKSWKIYERQGFETLQYFVDLTDNGKISVYSEYQTFELKPSSLGFGASGLLDIDSKVQLEGAFSFEIGATQIELTANAQMELLGSIVVASGLLRINDEGVLGNLQIGFGVGTGSLGSSLFTMSGTLQMEFNLTASGQTIQTLDVSKYGEVIGLKEGYIDPWTIRMAFGGKLVLFDHLELKGMMEMVLTPEGFEIDMAMVLDLSDLGELSLEAQAAILYTDDEPVFAFRAEANAMLGIPLVSIQANAIIEINTGSQVYAGVNPNTYRVALDGYLKILAFDIEFKGEISWIEDVLELSVDHARLSFFDFVNIDISGYIRSDGQFNIQGNIDIFIDLGWPEIRGGMALELSNNSFMARVYGSVEFNIGLTIWVPFKGTTTISKRFTLADFEAEISINEYYAYLYGEATVAGFTARGSKTFTWDKPSPIVQSGPIVLDIDDLKDELRDDYIEVDTPTYIFTADENDKTGKTIIVSSVNYSRKFTNVDKIVFRGSDEDEFVYVGPNVNAVLEFDGGGGNDAFMIENALPGSIIKGGSGDDKIDTTLIASNEENTENFITYYLGEGNNELLGNSRNETVYTTGGTGQISTSQGDDVIYSEDGEYTNYTGEGDDTFYISGGKHTFYAGEGDDIFNISGGVSDSYGGDGFDSGIFDVTSTNPFVMDDFQLSYDTTEFNFNLDDNLENTLEYLKITDHAEETVIQSNNSSYAWGSQDLDIISDGIINVTDAEFNIPDGQLTLISEGINGTINTDVTTLTVVNTATDEFADIIVREDDDLEIAANYVEDGGLNTENGAIDLQLLAKNSLLTHRSGIISTGERGGQIKIAADDINFRAGTSTISGTGDFILTGTTNGLTYKIGAQNPDGIDGSDAGPDGALDLSMQDIDALSDSFTQFSFGMDDPESVMIIGDLKDKLFENFTKIVVDEDGVPILSESEEVQTYTEETLIQAHLRDHTVFSAGNLTIAGNINSFELLTINAYLLTVDKKNISDPSGDPDSGITAREVVFNVAEQMTVSGWIVADDLIEINADGFLHTGQMTLLADHSRINITTSKELSIKGEITHDVIDTDIFLKSDENVYWGIDADINISGSNENEYDQIIVDGTLTIDSNSLNINLVNNFIPEAGMIFDIISYGSIQDKFDTGHNLWGFGDGLVYLEPAQKENKIALTTTPLHGGGDFMPQLYNLEIDKFGMFITQYFADDPIDLNGDFVLDNGIGISGGFHLEKVTQDYLKLSIENNQAFLGAGDNGLQMDGLTGGAIITRPGVASYIEGSAELIGLDELTLSGREMVLELNSTGESIDDVIPYGTEGNEIVIQYDDPIEKLSVTGDMEGDVIGFVMISGFFGFEKRGDDWDDPLWGISGNVKSGLEAGEEFFVGVKNGKLGLAMYADDRLSVYAQGNLQLEVEDYYNRSDSRVTIQYNNADEDYFETITIADTSIEMNVLANGVSVSAEDVDLNIADFVRIQGDFGFMKAGNDIRAAAVDATAILSAGDVRVGVADGNLGMYLNEDGTRALEVNGTPVVDLGLNINPVSVGNITVRWNETGMNLTGETLKIGEVAYTFTYLPASTDLKEVVVEDLELNISEFVHLKGSVSFQQSSQTVVLADGTSVDTDFISFGLSDVDVFAGINYKADAATGFNLDSANLAVALFAPKETETQMTDMSWTAVYANTKSIGPIGLPEDMSISANNFNIMINTVDGPLGSNDTVIDFAHPDVDISVAVTGAERLVFDIPGIKGKMLQVYGEMDIVIQDYFMIQGGIGFETAAYEVTLDTGETVQTQSLLFGSDDLTIFAGYNGPGENEGAIGLTLENANIALALLKPVSTDDNRSWLSFTTRTQRAAFVGIPGLQTLDKAVGDFGIDLNLGLQDAMDVSVAHLADNPLLVPTGGDFVPLSYDGSDGQLIRIEGKLALSVSDFVFMEGFFGFESSSET